MNYSKLSSLSSASRYCATEEERCQYNEYLLDPEMALRCTHKSDDKDNIIVTEKLDGECLGIVKEDAGLCPITKAGESIVLENKSHMLFSEYILANWSHLNNILEEGDHCFGEWLGKAYGTRYDLGKRSPYVILDIYSKGRHLTMAELISRLVDTPLDYAPVLHCGRHCSVERAKQLLGQFGHYGGIDFAEGIVYRMEREGELIFTTKFDVRKSKNVYLPEVSGGEEVWNWSPPIPVENLI